VAEPLRVAIVGTGFIGAIHARALAAVEGTALAAVLGRDPERTAAFAREHGAPRIHATLADLAADPGIDAAVICTPNDLHRPFAIELLRAGKHVLVEKPMALNAAEAGEMREVAERADRRLLVGHMWRFDREARLVRAAVERGDLGRVVKTKGYGIHQDWGPSGWFIDPARAGGGALIDMGVHALDTVRFLLGDPEPDTVFARLDTCYGDYEVDDSGVIVVTWVGGVVSIIESGWWNPHMDGPEASTQLFGTGGYARLFPTALRKRGPSGPVDVELDLPAREEHMDPHIFSGQIEEFAAAIREGRPATPGPAHGETVLRICDAAYQSSEEGRVVQL